MQKKTILFVSLFVVLLLLFGWAGRYYFLIFHPQFQIEEKATLYIDRDDTIDSIYHKITAQAHPKNLKGFQMICDYKKYGENIRTGKYEILSSETPFELYKKLSRGHQTPTKLVINSPRNVEAIVGHISKQIMIDSLEIANQLFDEGVLADMGYDRNSLMTFFIPNTYEVYWNIKVEDLLLRMQKEHNNFWNDSRKQKAKQIGLSAYEVAILASIVEEETAKNDEKATVAGLYMNRLKRGMPLQADPTVKYAIGDFTIQRITNQDLKIESPYNTYLYTGLPPGPIRIPTIKGIDSVLNYQEHNYIYMCAKEDFSGYHSFATNLAEHSRNARKYWDALNKRKIYR